MLILLLKAKCCTEEGKGPPEILSSAGAVAVGLHQHAHLHRSSLRSSRDGRAGGRVGGWAGGRVLVCLFLCACDSTVCLWWHCYLGGDLPWAEEEFRKSGVARVSGVSGFGVVLFKKDG